MIANRETDVKLKNQGEKKTWSNHFIDKAFTRTEQENYLKRIDRQC